MAIIEPFPGIRYNDKKVGPMGRVIIPPYDVISPAQLKEYLGRRPHNLIRLILAGPGAKTAGGESPYGNMAGHFREWQRREILRQDAQPAFYLYEQAYKADGKIKKRLGFLCILRLEPFGKKHVFAHEQTFSKPKADRLDFLRHFRANLEPLFGLYEDRLGALQKLLKRASAKRPALNVAGKDGIRHKLWPITETRLQGTIEKFLAPRPIFIADGHHRYEAALAYAAEQDRLVGAGPHDFVMMYLTNAYDDRGLTVMPYQRVLKNVPKEKIAAILTALLRYFETERLGLGGDPRRIVRAIEGRNKTAPSFGFYTGGASWLLCTLKKEFRTKRAVDASKSLRWNHLTPALADRLLLEKVLKITPDNKAQYVTYTPYSDQAVALVKKGKASAALLHAPARIETITSLARAGEKMPQKSTYFYPKLFSGLVMRKM